MIESGNENVNWRLCFIRERGNKVMQYINTVIFFWHDIPYLTIHMFVHTSTHKKILKTDLLLFY